MQEVILANCSPAQLQMFHTKEERDTGDRGAQSLLYMYYYEGGRQRHGPATAQKVINEETECGNMQQLKETQWRLIWKEPVIQIYLHP